MNTFPIVRVNATTYGTHGLEYNTQTERLARRRFVGIGDKVARIKCMLKTAQVFLEGHTGDVTDAFYDYYLKGFRKNEVKAVRDGSVIASQLDVVCDVINTLAWDATNHELDNLAESGIYLVENSGQPIRVYLGTKSFIAIH